MVTYTIYRIYGADVPSSYPQVRSGALVLLSPVTCDKKEKGPTAEPICANQEYR